MQICSRNLHKRIERLAQTKTKKRKIKMNQTAPDFFHVFLFFAFHLLHTIPSEYLLFSLL